MNKKSIKSSGDSQPDELSEDMEMVGPGQILTDARKKISLSVEDVAEKLKFTKKLVENIERDSFDQKLPATYNRGYLRSYAKLVNVDVDEVLSAYDMLGVAELQRSEMQSFSNLTEKQAEHSRLMWLSYFIAAILFGLMILWWQQEPKQTVDEKIVETPSEQKQQTSTLDKEEQTELITQNANDEFETDLPVDNQLSDNNVAEKSEITSTTVEPQPVLPVLEKEVSDAVVSENQEPVIELSTAVFTFSGDCWVNIYDASGERVAWGVKKLGYEMTVTGQAPFKVTLGKPELAAIVFNDQLVDMSEFNVGNIAKFTLPLHL